MLNFTPIDKERFFEPNYLKKQDLQNELDDFKKALQLYLKKRDGKGSENNHKGILLSFFEQLNYETQQDVDNGGGENSTTDLALFYEDLPQILIETKKPSDKKDDMFSPTNTNCKALHEAILYYLREDKIKQNLKIKFIIITDFYHFYIFDYKEFDRLFKTNSKIKNAFDKYKFNTPLFYDKAKEIISTLNNELKGFYLDLSSNNIDESILHTAFKLFHKDFLFSLFSSKDANEINEKFYLNLLKILGLKAVRQSEDKENKGDKKIVIKESGEKDTLYYAIKTTLSNKNKLTKDSFEDIMELIISWLNRILFIKLVEANLKRFNKSEKDRQAFLTSDKIKSSYDLSNLFFNVFAKDFAQRDDTKSPEFKLPYLNSSLFEPSECENRLCHISELDKKPLIALLDFLNEYDFSSGDENAKAENIINASILGKIFERLNGYKDGSVFTKSVVTSYMCKNAIEKVVVDKFNEKFKWDCENLQDLKKQIDRNFKNEADFISLLQSVKICDPAVGSGHFLVSALNEMIATYHTLGLAEGLNACELKLQNDEIVLKTRDGKVFEYQRPKIQSDERHKIQKALFELKRQIIENNLFGVDINKNSSQICKLRLWIELLKNSYYLQKGDEGFDENLNDECHQLQTLPNIDINIKCGNSLLNLIATQDGKDIENSVKWHKDHNTEFSNTFKAHIQRYNALVQEYKDKVGKKDDLRKQIQQIKDSLKKMLYTKPTQDKLDNELKIFVENYGTQDLNKPLQDLVEIYKETDKRSEWKQYALFSKKPSKAQINKIHKLYQDLQKAKDESIEWRYEFPEILNLSNIDKDNFGDFIGFDLIIGNPPYIRQEDIPNKERILKAFESLKLKSGKSFANSTADILTYFFPKGISVLKEGGILSLIISNKFARAGYGANLREFLLENSRLLHILDLNGVTAFDGVTVDTLIISCQKQKPNKNAEFSYKKHPTGKLQSLEFIENLHENLIPQHKLSKEAFIFGDDALFELKSKIESVGTPLKEWDIAINYGIKTGYNEAFIIDTQTKEMILKACDDSDKSRKPYPCHTDLSFHTEHSEVSKNLSHCHTEHSEVSKNKGVDSSLSTKAQNDKADCHADKSACSIAMLTERERTAKLIKPILRGRDIKRYSYEWAGLWLISTFPALKLNIDDYPALKKYLENFMPRIAQSGEKGCRKKTSNKWFETQDNIAYYEDFEKEKIVYSEIVREPQFYLDEDKFYAEATSFVLTGKNLKYLIALLNSKFISFVFKTFYAGGGLGEEGYRYKKKFLEHLPVPKITKENQNLADELVKLVNQILALKAQNSSADTSKIEKDIDNLIYKLYNLTPKEIEIVGNK